MGKEDRNGSEGSPSESSILQNPAIVFEKIDFLTSRFGKSDYQAEETALIEWLGQQWTQVYEVLDITNIKAKVNDFMTYSGKIVHAGSRETTTFYLHGEFNEHEIDLAFITTMPFGHLELQEVIATMVSKDFVPEQASNTMRGLEVTKYSRIKCNTRPLEIEIEEKKKIGSYRPKVGKVIEAGMMHSRT